MDDLLFEAKFGLPRYASFRVRSWMNSESEIVETCCTLPFYLQDLCLLVIINDLDCYPKDLLAALPYWLRHRILSCLPTVGLCHLEATPIAKGVNVDEIWESRLTEPEKKIASQNNSGNRFQLNISRDRIPLTIAHRFPGGIDLMADLSIDEVSPGHKQLLDIASDLLTGHYGSNVEKYVCQLISIPGDVLLSNLVTGTTHQTCKRPFCSQEVWKRQAIPLHVQKEANTHISVVYNTSLHKVRLTPHYLEPIKEKQDPVELLSYLTQGLNVYPFGVNIHIGAISPSILSNLCAERFALDHSMNNPAEDSRCMSIINNFLGKVVVLSLVCEKYSHIGLLVGMIKEAVANRQECRLKHLLCTLPDIYLDVAEPLSSLFSLPTFHQLTLDLDEVYLLMLSKLLQAFVTTPCQHKQKLMIRTRRGVQFPKSINVSQLASMDMGVNRIPSCSIEHKVLDFSSPHDFMNCLYILLQFPVIRLKKIELLHLSEYKQYVHMCAIHPDLQAAKLVIDFGTNTGVKQFATFQEDLVSLIKMPSLQKLVILGDWGQFAEIKRGLVLSLQGRAHMPPLKKLSLELESARSYKIKDLSILCDAIFSLPHLENLEVALGKGFADMIRQHRFREAMYNSWSREGCGIKVKSICLHSHETKLEQVLCMTEKLSFSSPKRKPASRLDFTYFGDYDSDIYDYDYDDYCYGYSNPFGYSGYGSSDDDMYDYY